MRGDLVMARTATALAAWAGRTGVAVEDVRRAALLALPHRRRRNPFDAPGLDEEKLDEVLRDAAADDPEDEPPTPPGGRRPRSRTAVATTGPARTAAGAGDPIPATVPVTARAASRRSGPRTPVPRRPRTPPRR
ncbi:hypothetical protein SDIAM26S_04776 [Streptomyces diastaticus subsp. diastaticus]